MLFYNLLLLEEATQCNPEYLVVALEKLWKGVHYPKNIQEKYKPIVGLHRGASFLLKPKPLFEDKSVDIYHKAHYIRLAGRRNYQLYKLYKVKSLDLSMYPDLDLIAISSNPLLNITNKQIHFKYEE